MTEIFRFCLFSTEPFTPDELTQIFYKCTFANINLPAELALKILALVTYYGGKIVQSIDYATAVTHAFSCMYDDTSHTFASKHSQVKLITPDWLVESVVSGKCVDEYKFNPRWLKNNPELVYWIGAIKPGNLNLSCFLK